MRPIEYASPIESGIPFRNQNLRKRKPKPLPKSRPPRLSSTQPLPFANLFAYYLTHCITYCFTHCLTHCITHRITYCLINCITYCLTFQAASKKHADCGALGEIDLEVQRVGSAEGILSTEVAVFSDAEYCYDAKLALVEPSINSDKYYILQIVKDGDDFVVPPPSYFVCSHWGRTGTAGQTKLDPVASEEAAVQQFEKVFKSKTGISWREQDPGADPKKGKYRHLAVSTAGLGKGGTGKWQYYLNHDPHGKRDGWYDYDPENSEQVELLHQDHASNPSMTCRFIHSDTSGFTYKVDLENGTQTNVTSGKERPIKRIKSK